MGLKGEWSLTAETALCLRLSSPKKGFRQKTVETTLAITDMPATTALAIADTPDTENLAVKETKDTTTSAIADNNNNTNDDGTVPLRDLRRPPVRPGLTRLCLRQRVACMHM